MSAFAVAIWVKRTWLIGKSAHSGTSSLLAATCEKGSQQAKELGITEDQVIRNVMLIDTVDGEFTTTADVAAVAVFFADFESNALTGQSLIVMQ